MHRGAAVGVLALCGCAVGPNFHRPAAPPVERYTAEPPPEAAGRGLGFEPAARIVADWWRVFNCAPLDTLVVHALQRNQNLQAAQASLRGSQDALRAGYGVFFPQLDVGGSAARERFSPLRVGVVNYPSTVFNLFTLQGTVSYTLDIWGGQRRQVEALRAQVDVARFTMLGTDIMLAGNVVDAVLARAAYQAEIDVTKEVIVLQAQQVDIAAAQAQAGSAPYANVLSLSSQLAATRATLPPLEQKIDQAEHLLATLSGWTPAEAPLPPVALSDVEVPRDVPVSVPSDLVRQRPDILVAEAHAHVASANIGVATAAMLPNFTLTGNLGVNNTTLGNLFAANSPFWSFGAGLTAPIFHGGTLYYQRREAVDAFDQAMAIYQETVLEAFQQVADALRGLTHDADAVAAQTMAIDSAEHALRLLQANFQSGVASYLQLLVADQQFLQARIAYVEALAQQLQDTVALYVALGGGWWNDPVLAERRDGVRR